MIKNETFMYDKDLDRLMIFNKLKADEKVYGSVNILNLTLDITTKNRIANIEIRDISEYLKSIDKDPTILNNMNSAKISIVQVRGGFLIQIVLAGLNKIEKIPYTIPTEEKILITA
ncbi:hypothetical protein J4229_01520 [Candidatus Pacearchaeota archaeon]|nr:hypothetical protein [Candidatus Pacearchaeota archaeon]